MHAKDVGDGGASRATLATVAASAGVSVATVSKVVNGRSDVAPTQAVRLDAFYIENWSLAFDFYIILKTISTVLERKGAY